MTNNPTPVERLRETIRLGAATVRDHYPELGGGALMISLAGNCGRLSRLVRPCTEDDLDHLHQWVALGPVGTYCEKCGKMMDRS